MTKVKSLWLFLCWGLLFHPISAQERIDSLLHDSLTIIQAPIKNSEKLMQEAIVHFDGGRYAKSVECLDEAIKANEFEQLSDILYYYRAVSKTKMNLLAEAIQDYSAAIALKPSKSKYIYHRGMVYFQTGDYEKAKNDFLSTLAIDGGNADIYLKLGFLKQQENDLQGAIEGYTKAIEFNSKLADAFYYRGLIYLQVLLPEKACVDLQKAVDLGHALAPRQYDKYCDR